MVFLWAMNVIFFIGVICKISVCRGDNWVWHNWTEIILNWHWQLVISSRRSQLTFGGLLLTVRMFTCLNIHTVKLFKDQQYCRERKIPYPAPGDKNDRSCLCYFPSWFECNMLLNLWSIQISIGPSSKRFRWATVIYQISKFSRTTPDHTFSLSLAPSKVQSPVQSASPCL